MCGTGHHSYVGNTFLVSMSDSKTPIILSLGRSIYLHASHTIPRCLALMDSPANLLQPADRADKRTWQSILNLESHIHLIY